MKHFQNEFLKLYIVNLGFLRHKCIFIHFYFQLIKFIFNKLFYIFGCLMKKSTFVIAVKFGFEKICFHYLSMQVYSRIITNRMKSITDTIREEEQAWFRKGCPCSDITQTYRMSQYYATTDCRYQNKSI